MKKENCKCQHDLIFEHSFSKYTGMIFCHADNKEHTIRCNCNFSLSSEKGKKWLKANKFKLESFKEYFIEIIEKEKKAKK